MFNVSDKVVCVNDSPGYFTNKKELEKDKIYVVSEILNHPEHVCGFLINIVGIDLGTTWDGSRIAFCPLRFRKLDEIKAENAFKKIYYQTQ